MRATTAPVTLTRPRRRLLREEAIFGYLFLAPWLIGLVVFVAGPMLASFYLSVTTYSLGVKPPEVTEELFASYLSTAGLPDPDLVVRTAGEMRLSNFLIWQSAYAEYYTTGVFWPDFDESQVDLALEAYAGRSRRFGGLAHAANGARVRNGKHSV